MDQWGGEQQTHAQSGVEERRYLVAQATGVFMARFGIGPEDAFDKLAGLARDHQRPLIDVAREIVEQLGR